MASLLSRMCLMMEKMDVSKSILSEAFLNARSMSLKRHLQQESLRKLGMYYSKHILTYDRVVNCIDLKLLFLSSVGYLSPSSTSRLFTLS